MKFYCKLLLPVTFLTLSLTAMADTKSYHICQLYDMGPGGEYPSELASVNSKGFVLGRSAPRYSVVTVAHENVRCRGELQLTASGRNARTLKVTLSTGSENVSKTFVRNERRPREENLPRTQVEVNNTVCACDLITPPIDGLLD